MKMKVLAIIPARGGSKTIPKKNIKLLAGKPLISYTIQTALSTKSIDRLVVSTDSKEIADIAKSSGAEIPFIRPKELAEDDVPTYKVAQHAVMELEKQGYKPDIVLVIFATSPFTTKETMEKVIDKLQSSPETDSVITGKNDYGHFWTMKNNGFDLFFPKEIKNRQLCEPLLREDGALYAMRYNVLMKLNRLFGETPYILIVDKNNVDVDDEIDFEFAEFLVKKICKKLK
jgi:CMP-N-acetylneuraminic acid synthetase